MKLLARWYGYIPSDREENLPNAYSGKVFGCIKTNSQHIA